MEQLAFQEQIGGNHCWGCGALNENGLQLKSYWDGEDMFFISPYARIMGG